MVIVEDQMDAIALHQAGFGGAVAPLGTALTEQQLSEIWRFSPEPVVCFMAIKPEGGPVCGPWSWRWAS